MSQTIVETAIVATIQLHADFDTTNAYLYDRRALGKGLDRLAIVSFEAVSDENITLTMKRRAWNYNVDVLVPWRGELATLDTSVSTETQKIIDTMVKYPRLNGTANIQRTDFQNAPRPTLMSEKKGFYRGRRHTLIVYEIVDPGRVE